MIQLGQVTALPECVELNVAQKRRSFKAHVIWRQLGTAGLMFSESEATDKVVPIEMARQLRKAQSEVRDLRAKLNDSSLD